MRERHPRPSSRPEFPLPLFELTTVDVGDSVVIALRGELDRSEQPRFETAIAAAESSRSGSILIDLDELTFIDVAGLTSLLNAQGRSGLDGDRLRISPGRGSVAALFQLTGLDLELKLTATELNQS